MIVQELIDQLKAQPADADVLIEDECCGCSNAAVDVMYVEDREITEFNVHVGPFVVITGVDE